MHDLPSATGKPIIAVCGARGNQGSTVARALLKTTKYDVRGITRHSPNSSEAKSLAVLGIEVVQADYDHPDSLLNAFNGCYGVFGVTNWYDAGSHETQQGKNIVNAAKKCEVKHFVWSSSPEVPGKLTSFTSKAMVAKYLESSSLTYTCILIPVYYETILMLIARDPAGGFFMNYATPPCTRTPYADLSDIGMWVTIVFNDPEKWCNKSINPCAEWLTIPQMAEIFSEATGEECRVNSLTPDQFLAAPENEILRGTKADIEYLMGSYDRQEWSTSLGHLLIPKPKTWRDVCEERFMEDSAVMSSPTGKSTEAQTELAIRITQDHDEKFL